MAVPRAVQHAVSLPGFVSIIVVLPSPFADEIGGSAGGTYSVLVQYQAPCKMPNQDYKYK